MKKLLKSMWDLVLWPIQVPCMIIATYLFPPWEDDDGEMN